MNQRHAAWIVVAASTAGIVGPTGGSLALAGACETTLGNSLLDCYDNLTNDHFVNQQNLGTRLATVGLSNPAVGPLDWYNLSLDFCINGTKFMGNPTVPDGFCAEVAESFGNAEEVMEAYGSFAWSESKALFDYDSCVDAANAAALGCQ